MCERCVECLPHECEDPKFGSLEQGVVSLYGSVSQCYYSEAGGRDRGMPGNMLSS